MMIGADTEREAHAARKVMRMCDDFADRVEKAQRVFNREVRDITREYSGTDVAAYAASMGAQLSLQADETIYTASGMHAEVSNGRRVS